LKDLEVGDRIKVAELRQLITDDPSYQNLTTEEEDKMKRDTLEYREQKKVGARPSNKSAAQDYRAQLTRMNDEARILLIYLFLLNISR
jgi:predicted secreted protein